MKDSILGIGKIVAQSQVGLSIVAFDTVNVINLHSSGSIHNESVELYPRVGSNISLTVLMPLVLLNPIKCARVYGGRPGWTSVVIPKVYKSYLAINSVYLLVVLRSLEWVTRRLKTAKVRYAVPMSMKGLFTITYDTSFSLVTVPPLTVVCTTPVASPSYPRTFFDDT